MERSICLVNRCICVSPFNNCYVICMVQKVQSFQQESRSVSGKGHPDHGGNRCHLLLRHLRKYRERETVLRDIFGNGKRTITITFGKNILFVKRNRIVDGGGNTYARQVSSLSAHDVRKEWCTGDRHEVPLPSSCGTTRSSPASSSL